MVSGLYLITDHDQDGRLLERVRQAIAGSVRVLQYRDKQSDPTTKLATARALAAICRDAGVTFLINDDPQLALESEADGVHLGQGDMTLAEARALLGSERIIGVSTRTPELARLAEAEGADYIGVGALYPTATKDDAQHIGLERFKEIRAAVRLPIVAIGGISAANAAPVIKAGADAVAVVSAVMSDPRPTLAARELALLFNARLPYPRGRVLTVAGSDSGGGAGIQADLKTITLLGSYGMSAITALTAQNTTGVRGIHPAPAEFVAAQIDAVLDDLGTDTIKTGMLFDAGIVTLVAAAIARRGLLAVVDPVMIAKGGAPLLQRDAVEAVRDQLLPQTYLLTPNLPEAEALTGLAIGNEAGMEKAARALQQLGARNVLLKGGHLDGDAVDLLLAGSELHRFPAPRIASRSTHGTGCTFSASIASFLAQGLPLVEAVATAKQFIHTAIATAIPLGSGHGPVNHWQAARAVLGS